MFLKGKSAIVTGSTSGIGLAYAQALAAEGASVMINGFGDADDIEKERAALAEKSGAKALYDAADMTKPDEIYAMIDRCHNELGGPDIVIANAGIQHVDPIEDFPIDKWNAIIAITISNQASNASTSVTNPRIKPRIAEAPIASSTRMSSAVKLIESLPRPHAPEIGTSLRAVAGRG